MAFWIVTAALWLVALLLAFLVLVLFRQFGVIYMGGRGMVHAQALQRGDSAPDHTIVHVGDESRELVWADIGAHRCWVVILSELGCPIADELVQGLDQLGAAWAPEAEVVFIDRLPADDEPRREPRVVPNHVHWTYATSVGEQVHRAFRYSASPTLYLIAPDSHVLSSDLVSGVRQISSLLAYLFDQRLDEPAPFATSR